MATNFAGYQPLPYIPPAWARETVSLRRANTTGHTFATVATNVICKADGEKQGLRVTDAGTFPAYERKFFFGVNYRRGADELAFKGLAKVGDSLVDDDGVWWEIASISNPAGADEHLEIIAHRGPAA